MTDNVPCTLCRGIGACSKCEFAAEHGTEWIACYACELAENDSWYHKCCLLDHFGSKMDFSIESWLGPCCTNDYQTVAYPLPEDPFNLDGEFFGTDERPVKLEPVPIVPPPVDWPFCHHSKPLGHCERLKPKRKSKLTGCPANVETILERLRGRQPPVKVSGKPFPNKRKSTRPPPSPEEVAALRAEADRDLELFHLVTFCFAKLT